jgi:hypothetical protein
LLKSGEDYEIIIIEQDSAANNQNKEIQNPILDSKPISLVYNDSQIKEKQSLLDPSIDVKKVIISFESFTGLKFRSISLQFLKANLLINLNLKLNRSHRHWISKNFTTVQSAQENF